jgi:erythronate-4-phosphate dehydrogenase
MKIVAEASIPYLRGVLEELGEVTYLPNPEITPAAVKDADWLIVRSITKCSRHLLEGSSVQLITSATIGYDHIDTAYCAEAGITWRNAPGCNADAVGQYVGCSLARCCVEKGGTLRGKTYGIVGAGHTGMAAARYAETLGMEVLLNDPPRADEEGQGNFVSLRTIAEECDYVDLHVPLTRDGEYPTYHLIDRDFIKSLRRMPVVINACRGPVTETDALLMGLRERRISNVIIDCWEGEPHPTPELVDAAWQATPHIAGFSADGKANGARTCVLNGLEFFGLTSTKLDLMTPAPPKEPVIDVSRYENGQRVWRALLHTYDPAVVDKEFRERYATDFEAMRSGYAYPREPKAYTVTNYTTEEATMLSRLGFRLAEE